ncbi:MAG TPA: hypothetical protein VKP04_03430, partial [Ktedonobacteraceae bacterium]|nr:hypothetical protein [Ktedonobacteraceae bacterium]
MQCLTCGTALHPGMSICPRCGTPLSLSASTPSLPVSNIDANIPADFGPFREAASTPPPPPPGSIPPQSAFHSGP